MKISKLMSELDKVKEEYGDLEVVYPDWYTDGCGSKAVVDMEVRKAKSDKERPYMFTYMRGPYARNRTIKKDTKVLELRDYKS